MVEKAGRLLGLLLDSSCKRRQTGDKRYLEQELAGQICKKIKTWLDFGKERMAENDKMVIKWVCLLFWEELD